MKALTVDATIENIETVTGFVTDELERINCPMKTQAQISIAIDELFGNIVHYAYQPEIGTATIKLYTEENPLTVIIIFSDNGIPFNPLMQAEPDIHADIETRQEGGMGIFLVKKLMDLVEYSYRDGQNILLIRKTIT